MTPRPDERPLASPESVDPQASSSLGAAGRAPGDFATEVLARLAERGRPATRYRPEGEIGQGGMGVVLGVWDEDLRRHLAMKVMLEQRGAGGNPPVDAVDPKRLARFLEEAQVTGQLDHPGIVPVHELGLDGEGRVYFTMKLVQGKTLKNVFEELARGEGGWTQTRVLSLLLKVCEAMSYAHAKGVIHRDLKPANVMVGRFGEVFVMDWGLARVLGREDSRDLRIRPEVQLLTSQVESGRRHRGDESPDSPLYTLDGDVVGTPAYMPPEQAAGRVEEIGPAADVYALGAMLYHLIAGHMPYLPPGTRANNYAIWQRVQEGPPRALPEIAPDAHAELVAICEKAMARPIAQRYPDMAALAEDLAAYVEGRVVRAYEAGAWATARKWVRRNRPLAAALLAGVLVLIAGLAVSSSLYVRARDNAARANERAEDVLRLSALQDLEDLNLEADALWPPHPESIAPCRAWIGRAEALAAELPRHRAQLDELRAQAPPRTEEERSKARWWDAQLTKLIVGLEALQSGLLAPEAVTPEHGWSVAKRLAFALELESGFAPGGKYTEAWERALPEIRAAHPGLTLPPQMGLVPIGNDRASGLWEFAHLATGAPAERDADGRLVLTERTGVVLVLIPEGSFWMGAQSTDPAGRNFDPEATGNEGPVHEVELSAHFLAKYELTQGQWERMAGQNPSEYGPWRYFHTWDPAGKGWNSLHPVEQVSWFDCTLWLPRVGLALPSEAQWEHGCRGGTTSIYACGNEKETLRGVANLMDAWAKAHGYQHFSHWEEWLDDGNSVHAVVGSYAANGFGLHEMHGNTWEWCLDPFVPSFYGRSPRRDPVGSGDDATERVYRGGSFDDDASTARSSKRDADAPKFADDDIGVRPAKAITR